MRHLERFYKNSSTVRISDLNTLDGSVRIRKVAIGLNHFLPSFIFYSFTFYSNARVNIFSANKFSWSRNTARRGSHRRSPHYFRGAHFSSAMRHAGLPVFSIKTPRVCVCFLRRGMAVDPSRGTCISELRIG
jgi:hypothetical protein